MRFNNKFGSVFLAFFLGVVPAASAQNIPTSARSGIVEKGLEESPSMTGIGETAPPRVLDIPDSMDEDSGSFPEKSKGTVEPIQKLPVTRFRFYGNRVISSLKLKRILQY